VEAIVVHGGAWAIPDSVVADHLRGCERAAGVGADVLGGGGTALDAVEAAVGSLEDDPTYDAGRGAFLNREGAIELDACIMDGATLRAGAVAAVRNILHPVTLARRVMELTDHVMLVGEGANLFAAEIGVDAVREEDLLVGRELERWQRLRQDPKFRARVIFEPPPAPSPPSVPSVPPARPGDTVGAVALDRDGHMAAGTSTGGTPKKRMGRVGDSPIVGAGAYADDAAGAVSATGWGEPIMRSLLSLRVLEAAGRGVGIAEAADAALEVMLARFDGRGGVICLTPRGEVAARFTTPRMAHAVWRAGGGGDGAVRSSIDASTVLGPW
jgi:beta-aspartyl-peptidase (threonine type)